jgi:hypothetical protein
MNTLKLAGTILPLLIALDAAAMTRVMPVPTRINPLVGLPTLLPSPLTGPFSGRGVTLPSPVLTPSVSLMTASPLAAAPRLNVAVAAAPAAAPAALPRVQVDARRENVAMPALLPESVLRFAAAADSKKTPVNAPRVADDLRNLFDGARKPDAGAWEPIFPRERAPKPSRRHGLPEDDLERELGVEPQF